MKRLSQGKLNKKYYEEFVDRSKWEKELWQKRGNWVMEVQVKKKRAVLMTEEKLHRNVD